MKRFVCWFVWACAALAVAADGFVRVNVTSEPEGADVSIDGASVGRTPLSANLALADGPHALRLSLEGFEPHDECFSAVADGTVSRSRRLTPETGILLVRSEPAGCSLSIDHSPRGQTPLLVTDLPVGRRYRIRIERENHVTHERTVEIKDRAPVVVSATLASRLGTLAVRCPTPGATVFVDGCPAGVTADGGLVVPELRPGRVEVGVMKDGFKTWKGAVRISENAESAVDVALEVESGSLRLLSEPEGARFYVDGHPHGKGPVTVKGLLNGPHVVKAVLDGYATVERTVETTGGSVRTEEFVLSDARGRLEIRTSPPGVQVFVDGHARGVTKPSGEGSRTSSVLEVPALADGVHTVVLKRAGYGEVVRRAEVKAKAATVLEIRMKRVFTPDVEVKTVTGPQRGVLVSQTAAGIQIETSPGIVKTIPRSDVRGIEFLEGAR